MTLDRSSWTQDEFQKWIRLWSVADQAKTAMVFKLLEILRTRLTPDAPEWQDLQETERVWEKATNEMHEFFETRDIPVNSRTPSGIS